MSNASQQIVNKAWNFTHGCEFNVVMGLCIGHDSIFFKHAMALDAAHGCGYSNYIGVSAR